MAFNLGMLGNQLGEGIGRGLNALAQNKINNKLEEDRVHSTANALISGGLSRADAYTIANTKDPVVREHIIKSLQNLEYKGEGAGNAQTPSANPMQAMSGLGEKQAQPQTQPQGQPQAQPQAQPQQAQPVQQASAATTKEPLKVFRVGKGGENSAVAKKDVAWHKYENENRDQLKSIDNLIFINEQALKLLDSGDVKTGFISHTRGKLSPSLLANDATEAFQKYSNQVVEARAAALKGIKSKYLVNKIEESKFGLNHNEATNRLVLKESIEAAKKAKNQYLKAHPYLIDEEEEEQYESEKKAEPKSQARELGEKNINPNQIEPGKETAPENSLEPRKEIAPENPYLKKAKEVGAGALAASASALGLPLAAAAHVGSAADYLRGKTPTQEEEEIRQRAKDLPSTLYKATANQLGYSEKDVVPKALLNKAVQSTASDWPLLAISGVAGLPLKVARNFAQSVGGESIANVTDYRIAKIVGHILGGKGFDSAAGWFNGIAKAKSLGLKDLRNVKSTNISPVQAKKEGLYEYVDKTGPTIKLESNKVREALDDVASEVKKDTKLSTSETKEILSKIKKYDSRFSTPSTNLGVLQTMKKDLNENWKNAVPRSEERAFYTKLRDSIDKVMDENGPSKWNQARKAADELHSLQNWKTGFTETITNLIPSGKLQKLAGSGITQGAISILSGIKGGIPGLLTAGVAAVPLAVKGGESVARAGLFLTHLSSTPEGKKLLWDIAANSAKKSGPALYKDLFKLNHMASKFEKEKAK